MIPMGFVVDSNGSEPPGAPRGDQGDEPVRVREVHGVPGLPSTADDGAGRPPPVRRLGHGRRHDQVRAQGLCLCLFPRGGLEASKPWTVKKSQKVEKTLNQEQDFK